MNKLILSFMYKDEENVVLDMLKSCQSILDGVVALDTGSTDSSESIISNFCKNNNIPYYPCYYKFTNFRDSRNALKESTMEYINMEYANYDISNVYWFSIDCDDMLVIGDDFDVEQLNADVYDITIRVDDIIYRKPSIFRTTDNGTWYGVVHEHYITNSKVEYFDMLNINVRRIGNTWGSSNKYILQALELEKEIARGDISIRNCFYAAEAYLFANNKDRAYELFRYIIDNFDDTIHNREYIYYSYYQCSFIKIDNVNLSNMYLLSAYNVIHKRAEAINVLIQKYFSSSMINVSYMYSYMIVNNLKGETIYPDFSLYIDEKLYYWGIYKQHIEICDTMGIVDNLYDMCKHILDNKFNI